MSKQALALKYRPKDWNDVVQQGAVVQILSYMIDHSEFPNCMLFAGAAGCGKTTSARIMADKINKGKGSPIEIDAASNNGVEQIRDIAEKAKFRSIDSEYKVFIIDECHMISTAGWNSALKLIEEPPAKTIFIFCTTNPEKIPETIHSRVQRFDFNKITFDGITNRLEYIINKENKDGDNITFEKEAIDYIAKISEGGLRNAITMMDKCISYSKQLTVNNVIEALGVEDYELYFKLVSAMLDNRANDVISIIEKLYFFSSVSCS